MPTTLPADTGDVDDEQVASFYREYNATLLHDLIQHGISCRGHYPRAASDSAALRRRLGGVCRGVLLDSTPEDSAQSALAIRLQQLKMQARMAINTILDIRVHSMEMSEDEALRLMTFRGFQEEGEAIGKWRRALLTAGQLPTYFVGYQAVRSIANDLRVVHPDWSDRQVHDLMLSHGSPAPRHLRTLIGI